MFDWLRKKKVTPRGFTKLPAVRFDRSRVTDEVKHDLWESIAGLKEVGSNELEGIHQAAIASVQQGGNLFILSQAILKLKGMTRKRAGEIALALHNRATALMDRSRQLELGIEYAVWRYSGAPCGYKEDGFQHDAAHRKMNGKCFKLVEGAVVGKRQVLPGQDAGCKCGWTPIIPGLGDV